MVAKTFDYGPSSRSSFADVEGHPAANYISGLVPGGSPPTGELFRPDDPITRGEASDMVIRGLGAEGGLRATCRRAPPPSRMWSRNIPTGEPSNWHITRGAAPPAFTNRFHPESHLTRGEAAAMLRGSGVSLGHQRHRRLSEQLLQFPDGQYPRGDEAGAHPAA